MARGLIGWKTALSVSGWTAAEEGFGSMLAKELCGIWSPTHKRDDLFVPRTRLQLGNRTFCVTGPVARNSLPLHIRSAPTLSTFKNMLKTYLFSRSYFSDWLFPEYEQRTLYGALVVTIAMLLCLINCRFIIILFNKIHNRVLTYRVILVPTSPTGHSFCTYITNFQKHAQDTSLLMFLLHWLTVSLGVEYWSN